MRSLFILLLAATLGAAADLKFASPSTIANGSPFDLTQGDFNGDGQPDLLVTGFAQTGSNSVNLYPGLGKGQFGAPVSIYQAQYCKYAITGDFNHDGRLDIAVLVSPVSAAGMVAVLLGNGNGTFQPPVITNTQAAPAAIVAGDFNHDGNLDVAVANNGQLQVFPGHGDGSFGAPVSTTLAGAGYAMAVADFNGDGNLDVVLSLTTTVPGATIQLFLGNGDGSFEAPSTLLTTGGYALQFGLAAGDLNGDHIPDVIVLEVVPSSAQILLGNGDGTFQPAISYYVSRYPSSVLIADVTGDGKPDLIVACSEYGVSAGGEVAVLPGNGDGTFQPPINSLVGTDALAATAGDYNGDGKLDLALMSDFDVIISLGTGDGHFQQPANYPANRPGSVVTGDFNSNGILDVAVTTNNGFEVLPGLGNGRFGKPQRTNQTVFLPVLAATGDFNHDGITDLVVTGSHSVLGGSPFYLQVYFGATTGLTPGPLSSGLPFNITSITTGGFVNGGPLDLAFSFNGTGNRPAGAAFLPGKGDGTFGKPVVLFQSTSGFTAGATAADFNGDGNLDLAVASGTQVYVMPGNGDGTFRPAVSTFVANDQLSSVVAADFNGDNKIDLAIGGSYNMVYVLLGNGDGTFQPAAAYPTDKLPMGLAAADFNCDGKLDLATANYNGNDASVLLGNGDGTFQPRVSFAAGSYPLTIAAGDFQGNGKSSLVVANSFSNSVSVLLNQTLTKPGACR